MVTVSKIDWLVSLRGADLTHAEFRVLIVLATFTDSHFANAYPSNARLAQDAHVHPKTLGDVMKSLSAKGWIRLDAMGGNRAGKGLANVWRVIPKGESQTPPSFTQGGVSDSPFKGRKGESQTPSRGSLRLPEGGVSDSPHPVIDPVIDPGDARGRTIRTPTDGTEPVDKPPSPHCPRHPTGTLDRCGACGDARRARTAYDAAAAQHAAAGRSARRAAIDACPMCDEQAIRIEPAELRDADLPAIRCDHTTELTAAQWRAHTRREEPGDA